MSSPSVRMLAVGTIAGAVVTVGAALHRSGSAGVAVQRPGLLVLLTSRPLVDPAGYATPEVVAFADGRVLVRADPDDVNKAPAYWESRPPAGSPGRKAVDAVVRRLCDLTLDTTCTLTDAPQSRLITAVHVPAKGQRRILTVRVDKEPAGLADVVGLADTLRATADDSGHWVPVSEWELLLTPVTSGTDVPSDAWPSDVPVPPPAERGTRRSVLALDADVVASLHRRWVHLGNLVYEASLRPVLPEDDTLRAALGLPTGR